MARSRAQLNSPHFSPPLKLQNSPNNYVLFAILETVQQATRFKPQDLSPIKTQIGDVFAGATKSFEHQILLGFHLGVEYQNSSLTQSAPRSLLSKMRASNWIYSLDLHSKIPLPAFKNSLTPFLRIDLSALLVQNTYSLSPNNEKTQELRKLSGGMILDFLAGAEFKTSFALFTFSPRVNLGMQAALFGNKLHKAL